MASVSLQPRFVSLFGKNLTGLAERLAQGAVHPGCTPAGSSQEMHLQKIDLQPNVKARNRNVFLNERHADLTQRTPCLVYYSPESRIFRGCWDLLLAQRYHHRPNQKYDWLKFNTKNKNTTCALAHCSFTGERESRRKPFDWNWDPNQSVQVLLSLTRRLSLIYRRVAKLDTMHIKYSYPFAMERYQDTNARQM